MSKNGCLKWRRLDGDGGGEVDDVDDGYDDKDFYEVDEDDDDKESMSETKECYF